MPYETTVEASMNKSAKENFIDHAHKLLRNNLDVKLFAAVILKNRLLNRFVTVALRLRSCRSHGLSATDRDTSQQLGDNLSTLRDTHDLCVSTVSTYWTVAEK